MLAVACDHRVVAAGDSYRADDLLRRVPARARQCVSAGRGAKGHRLYDWAFIRLDDHAPSPTHRTRHPPSAGLIRLTCNEVQHLLATLLDCPAGDLSHRLRWSRWRRRHQARAAPATTNDKPTDHEDHELRLEY